MSTKYQRKLKTMSEVVIDPVEQAPEGLKRVKKVRKSFDKAQFKKNAENAAVKTVAGGVATVKFLGKALGVVYHTPIRVLDKAPSAIGGVLKTIGTEAKKAWNQS